MFSKYSNIVWYSKSPNLKGIVHNKMFYPNGDLLKGEYIDVDSTYCEPILPEMNTKHFGIEYKKVGGLGKHTRIHIQTSNSRCPVSLLALGVNTIKLQNTFEQIVYDHKLLEFKDESDPYYNFEGGTAADLILSDRSKLVEIVILFSLNNISIVSLELDEFMTVLADKFTRTYEMFTHNEDHALNKPTREINNWIPITYMNEQHYTCESLTRSIAKHTTIPTILDTHLPPILREGIARQELFLNNPTIIKTYPKKLKGDMIPRLCSEYQTMIIKAFLLKKYSSVPTETMHKINSLLLFFGMYGYIPHQLGSYVRSDKYRGAGERVRTFSNETKGLENIANASLKRVNMVDGEWVGKKFKTDQISVL